MLGSTSLEDLSLEELLRTRGDTENSPIDQVLIAHLTELKRHNVRIIRNANDLPYQVLARTIQEQRREKEALLRNKGTSHAQRLTLQSAEPQSVQQVIALDNLLDSINTALAQSCLPPDRAWSTGIYLSDLGLTRLPRELVEIFKTYPLLIELDLRGNELHTLPSAIGELKTLTRLYLSRNLLKTLPNTLGNLRLLSKLLLDHNPISRLPESLYSILQQTGNRAFMALIYRERASSMPSSSMPTQSRTLLPAFNALAIAGNTTSSSSSANQVADEHVANDFVKVRHWQYFT